MTACFQWCRRLRRASIASALLATLIVVASAACATDPPVHTPAPAAQGSQVPAETGDAPTCVHGCQRWGESCNVDPRGVYKCQRRCEKFGEICE